MQERAKADALKQLPESERSTAKWEYLNDQPYYKVVKADARLTPFVDKGEGPVWKVTLPHVYSQFIAPMVRPRTSPP